MSKQCGHAELVPGCGHCCRWARAMSAEAISGAAGPGRPVIQTWSNSAGIGDHLLGLAIAQGLSERYPWCEIVAAAPSWVHPWLALFGGYDRLSDGLVAGPVCHCDNSGDWPLFTREGKSRWQYWADKFGVRASRPLPKPVAKATAEWSVPYVCRIVLAPFAAYKERTWPLPYWVEVERVLSELGFECVILDHRAGRMGKFSSGGQLAGEPAERVVSVIRSSLCTVSNDSGMAHVAGMSGVRGVCISARVSDRDIMGLYPTIFEMGGPGGSEAVRPADVVGNVVMLVRQGIDPVFPRDRFVRMLHPDDGWRRECWPPMYAVLHRAVRLLQPSTVVEIGTRAGAGSWVILDAAPAAQVHTIDLPEPGSGGVSYGAAHARQLLAGQDVTFHVADSTKLERLPVEAPDLVYVDGDHCYRSCLSDLELAERSGAKVILVDDYTTEDVRAACAEFLSRRPHLLSVFFPSQTGLLQIR